MAFIFNGNSPKEIKYNGNNVAKLIYNNVVVWLQKFLATITGNTPITLTKATSDTLDEATVYGMCEQGRLPEGYTELEYLQSDASAYINTHFNCTSNSGLKIKYRYIANGSAAISGIYTSTTPRTDALFISSISGATSGTNETIFATTNGYVSAGYVSYSLSLNADYVTEVNYLNSGETYINDIFNRQCGTETPNNGDILLFARKNANNDNITASNSRIYYAIFTENQTVSKYFIPAKRNSDGVLGMYDVINNVFETNVGTGSFTAGAEIVPTPDNPMPIHCNNGELKVKDSELPVGYKRVKDLIYDGNSYFITNYKLKGSDTLRFKFNAIQSGVNVMGCYNGVDANNNFSYYLNTGSQGSYARYGSELYRPKAQSLNTDYNVVFSPTGITGLDNNISWQAQTFTSSAYFYIGWLDNASSSPIVGAIKGNVEIDNTAKFIPCERLSDNALGYYDTYSNTFFENQGMGTLSTSGYDYTYTPEIYTDGTVETVKITGKNIFNQSLFTTNVGTILTYVTYNVPNGTYTMSTSNFPVGANGTTNVFFIAGEVTNGASSATNGIYEGRSITITVTNGKYTVCYRSTTTLANTNNPADYNWQIEHGSTATAYEPYYNGGTATCENLLSVSTYEDIQEVISGSVTRNVGIKVLDGTEDWSVEVLRQKNNFYFYLQNVLNSSSVLCTIAKYATESYSYVTVPSCKFISKTFNIIPATNTTTFPTVASWEEYLADQYANGTPVILVYSLETPTTETVTGQTLTAQEGTNIVDSSLDNREMEITYYRTN